MKTKNSTISKSLTAAKTVALAFVWSAPVVFVACGSGEKASIETRETQAAENAIESYADKPSDQAKADVNEAFAVLDKEIAELEARVASTGGEKRAEADAKLQELKERKNELKGDYTKTKFDTLVEDAKNAVR
jgi:hypothetical protein